MNAKTCKKLRRIARARSVGLPYWQLVAMKTNSTTALNDQKSTRGIYRGFKRFIRMGATLAAIEQAVGYAN